MFCAHIFATWSNNPSLVYADSCTIAARITDLNAFPLRCHQDEDEVRKKIIARGRRWESYAGQNFFEYSGLALGEMFRYNM